MNVYQLYVYHIKLDEFICHPTNVDEISGTHIPNLSMSVLNLRERTKSCMWNCFRKEPSEISLWEIIQLTESNYLSIRGFGKLSLADLKKELAKFGLELTA